MTKVFTLNYMKPEASNWRLCSCGCWRKHFIPAFNCCGSKDRIAFSGPVATLLLNQKQKRDEPKKNNYIQSLFQASYVF